MSRWFFWVFPICIPLVYSLGASYSFLINILLFTDKKNKKEHFGLHSIQKFKHDKLVVAGIFHNSSYTQKNAS